MGVTFSIGTTTFDKGASFFSTSNSLFAKQPYASRNELFHGAATYED
jgi:hypothetical protein